MEVYHLTHPHRLSKSDLPPSAMALGFFDGVHYGHQEVIRTAKAIAKEKGIQASCMTFYPPPAVVLGKKTHPEYLTPNAHKQRLIEALGIDQLFILRFDESVFSLSPGQFVDQYIDGLNVRHAVTGFDFTYGSGRAGTAETLADDARGRFGVTVVRKVEKNGEKISSTKIRSLVRQGKVDEVPAYLSRCYEMNGTVGTGEKRGRSIGFPTANIDTNDSYLIPQTGIYAVKMNVNQRWLNGVASIGYKPTFHDDFGEQPAVEVYLFDFNDNIYGEVVTIRWYKKLRDEEKFASVEALVRQMNADVQDAKAYFQRLDRHEG